MRKPSGRKRRRKSDRDDSVPTSAEKEGGETDPGPEPGVSESGTSKAIPTGRKSPSQLPSESISHNLIRLESRRKARLFFRRLFWLLLIVAVVAAIWFICRDRFPTEQIQEFWESFLQKMNPARQ